MIQWGMNNKIERKNSTVQQMSNRRRIHVYVRGNWSEVEHELRLFTQMI